MRILDTSRRRTKMMLGGLAMVPIIGLGGVAYAATLTQGSPAPAPVGATATVPGASDTGSAAEAPETASSAEASDTGNEADAPGGHADAANVNVDHQFEGQE